MDASASLIESSRDDKFLREITEIRGVVQNYEWGRLGNDSEVRIHRENPV